MSQSSSIPRPGQGRDAAVKWLKTTLNQVLKTRAPTRPPELPEQTMLRLWMLWKNIQNIRWVFPRKGGKSWETEMGWGQGMLGRSTPRDGWGTFPRG